MDYQSIYVQYTGKENADNKTHGNDSKTNVDTNDEHIWIDEDETTD